MANRKKRTTIDFDELNETPLQPGGDNWETCVQAFMENLTLRNLSYYTKKYYKDNFNVIYSLLKTLDYPTAPNKITPNLLKKIIVYLIETKKAKPLTINHRIKTTKQLFSFLHREGYLNQDPSKNIEKVKSSQNIIESFTKDQARELLAQPNKRTFVGFRDYCLMLILLDTGVRLNELLNIRIEDIDLKQRCIKVMGKGAKERYVFFNSTTQSALKKYISIRGYDLSHSYLWINNGDEVLNRNTVQDRLKQYGNKAGIKNTRVSPHTFRHTFAKFFILNGGSTLALQNLLGHSTLEMVRVYVHLWGTDLQAMHQKFSPVDKLSL